MIMKRLSNPHPKFRAAIVSLVIFISTLSWAAEIRMWTDKKGRTLEGKLEKIDGEEAIITLKNGKEIRINRSLLSSNDNNYLTEYGGGEAVVLSGKVGTPEKDARIDTKTFTELPDPFIFPDTEITFDAMETEHFLILTKGSFRPKNIAETAERLWHGMAFQHPTFRNKWGKNRRAIFVVDDEDTHKMLGEWYREWLSNNGGHEQSLKLAITWPKSTGGQINLPPEIAEPRGLLSTARVFKVTKENDSSFKKVFTPFVTHCVASDMLTTQMGGTSSFGAAGRFSIVTGHSYYKEIQLAGESGTSLISAKYDSSDIQSARGFANGTDWAKELKKLVRKGTVKPSIEALYKYEADTLTPEELVLLYSFSYFMQGDMGRLAAYTKMIERAESSRQIPEAIEIAKIFGFETPEALEIAWTEFISSSAFKD